MKNVIVLGAGMVGSVIAVDLTKSFNTSAADLDTGRLTALKKYGVSTIKADFSDNDAFNALIENFDIVVNAVPGSMGHNVLKKIILSGKDVVDISFSAEDPFLLEELAISKNITAVVDCGIAPGLSNIILGHHYAGEKISSYDCYVGGLPFERKYPFQYKAPFSPSDVIEEYTRPARIKESGKIRIKEALSEPEFIEFDEIGTLEAFNSDGLRTLVSTMDIPDMKEKTLRYPGHLQAVKLLKDAGFFSHQKLNAGGTEIAPVDLTSLLLFKEWQLKPTDDEFTVLRVIIAAGQKKITYDLFDRRDKFTGFSSMSRTTGYTCTAAVNLVAEGLFARKGICPPEYIGMEPGCINYVFEYLGKRNITIKRRESINP